MVSGASSESVVAFKEVTKRFDDFVAVDRVSVDIRRGEFFSLLGPSGCGKTTMLRMIAGFEEATEGQLLLEGREVGNVPPYRRHVNTVFQNYALFPHLTVSENIAFGPRIARLPEGEITRRVERMLDVVRLRDLASRRPHQLSGGQRQRVALARALINAPVALLLDEPLSALDLELRRAMQLELKRIQREVGITFVFVTHDQEEALTMSDRIAVMRGGRIEQVGAPEEVYERPATAFVARFIGIANLLPVRVLGVANEAATVVVGESARLEIGTSEFRPAPGENAALMVRPERLRVCLEPETPPAAGELSLEATLREVIFQGPVVRCVLDVGAGRSLVAHAPAAGRDGRIRVGSRVALRFPQAGVRLLAPDSTLADD